MSKVSINLVTWNGERFIEDCLDSVFKQTFIDYSIIIIDNGSSDKTVEIISNKYPHLKIVRHNQNFGYAKAHNQAIHWTKSDYVLCLNQDVILESSFLSEMVMFMDQNNLCGSATGKLYRLQEGQKTKYFDSLGLRLHKNYKVTEIRAGEMDDGKSDISEQIFGISGALSFYRRKALEDVVYKQEYFDENFFSYKEDVDMAHRLLLAGWKSFYVPRATACHARTASAPTEELTNREIIKNRKRKSQFVSSFSYRNHLYFIYKNLPQFKVKYLWPIFIYELLKFIYVLFCETKNLKAWSELFKNRKVMKQKREVTMKNVKIKFEDYYKWLN